MASPSTTSVIVPAFNEGEAIAAVVGALKAGAPWHEVIDGLLVLREERPLTVVHEPKPRRAGPTAP